LLRCEWRLSVGVYRSVYTFLLKRGWVLGDIQPGWEWLAFTFGRQDQMQLTAAKIDQMLDASDQVARQAYARMTLDAEHAWASHTDMEVDFVIEHCELEPGKSVLDLGCGVGRHSGKLAEHGFCVTGVDYLDPLIKRAREEQKGVSFICNDCRTLQVCEQFDCVICLYDIIGSYADASKNFEIIRTIKSHLKPGGKALVSVRNRALVEAIAINRFRFKEDPDRLLELPPSDTMESTGDIFSPDHFLLDDETHVVYRKEQFTRGDALPTELVVRDRRYLPDEMVNQLEEANKKFGLDQLLKRLDKIDLLIVDELGYLSFSRSAAELLFQVFADHYERRSLLITSNLSFSALSFRNWGQIFQGERMTAALLDRLTHHCHIFEMNGESFRFKESMKEKKPGTKA
jgi:SAM-dependent methyltransferase